MDKQKDIVSILSSLDDKIELNLQMNKTLESIAQAIFKEWFVDFRFPGFDGELVDGLPRGWNKVSIGTLFKTDIGGDWGKEASIDDYSVKAAVIRGTDFGNISNGDISRIPIRYIRNTDYIKKKVINGDILLEISGGSKDQPTGRTLFVSDDILGLIDCPVVPASFCRLIRPLNFRHSIFLSIFFSRFYEMGGTWEYQNQSTGISNFQFRYFSENMKIYFPSDGFVLQKFSEIVEPMVLRIHRNIVEIHILSQLRDTLLPKLMTGKIRVP